MTLPGPTALAISGAQTGRERPPSPGASRARVPALDGLRGIAILSVVIYHFTAGTIPKFEGFARLLYQFPNAGWGGVDLFFVLSGFLITGILCDAKGSPAYFRTFYMRRVLRIFPLYYGYLFVLFVVVPLLGHLPPTAERHLRDQVWLWSYGTNYYYALPAHPLTDSLHLQHFWSLAVEEQFYLVWPLVVFLSRRETVIRICIVCMVAALACRVALLAGHFTPLAVWNLTFCRMDGLAIGALCALVVRTDISAATVVSAARAVIIVSALGLAAILCWRGEWNWDDPVMETIGISFLSGLCGGVLLLALDPSGGRRVMRWLLTRRVLTTFGFYSYAIYVFHYPLMMVFDRWFPVSAIARHVHSLSLGLAIYVVWGTLLSLLAGVISWQAFEKHFMRVNRHFAWARPQAVAESSHAPATLSRMAGYRQRGRGAGAPGGA